MKSLSIILFAVMLTLIIGKTATFSGGLKFGKISVVEDKIEELSNKTKNTILKVKYRFAIKWGSQGTGNGEFNDPYNVAVCHSLIYVIDGLNKRVKRFGSDGNYLSHWDDDSLNGPQGIETDSMWNIYVADGNNSRIMKYDSYAGVFISSWNVAGRPVDIAIDASDSLYVITYLGSEVKKYDSSGNYVQGWGSSGTANGQFIYPMSIATDKAGYVYVTDTYNHRIQKFTSDGNFVSKWGGYGTGDVEFNNPMGIAADSSGYVYVVDSHNHRIQKFDSEGNFITKWGSNGTGDGQFTYPQGIALDEMGNVYVADVGNNRIQKFSPY